MDTRAVQFLVDASLLYQESCPELSRFLLQKPQKGLRSALPNFKARETKWIERLSGQLAETSPKIKFYPRYQETLICQYCYQWLRPGNHRMRIRPKRRASVRVQRVLRREARGRRLSLTQKVLLRRFRNSPSTLMATCHSCNKTSRYNGVNRGFMTSFSKNHSTPGNAGKRKTPQSANRANMTGPKSASKDKTPCNTPRSIPSNTPGSGSSPKPLSKVKKWVVQRLSKLLIREDKQDGKKGGLKDFLSSL